MKSKKIGIIGAGVMGSSTALDFACHQFKVILKDTDSKILDQAKEKIKNEFRMVKMIKKEFKELEIDNLLDRIDFVTDYSQFSDVDFVLENISEDFKLKKEVYKEINQYCPEDFLFAANTSCISITRIAAEFVNPDKVIGLHFMNPVPLKKMVETVKGYHTSDETIEKVSILLKSIGKTMVIVNDSPGFVSNRLSHLFMNEAAFLVLEGVAEPEKIDLIFKQGFGHAMGPLETADLIGLDTVVNSLNILYQSYQDPKFRCCPLLQKMVNAGFLGRKSGKGFFTYN